MAGVSQGKRLLGEAGAVGGGKGMEAEHVVAMWGREKEDGHLGDDRLWGMLCLIMRMDCIDM